jgi:hypothetical protein
MYVRLVAMGVARLQRNSFFVDPRALRRAQRALKVRTTR